MYNQSFNLAAAGRANIRNLAAALKELDRRGLLAAIKPPAPPVEEEEASAVPLSADPVEWLEGNFYIPETEAPITLADYQKLCLREALSRDNEGNFKYSLIVWSDIKKSAKSTIAAGVGLWVAYHTKYGRVKIVANDLKQADSRVAASMRLAVQLNPAMRQEVRTKNYNFFLPHNGAQIEAVPVDPKGEAGANDDCVIYSELWAATNTAAQRMWTETTLSPTKFGRSFRWVESYAGIEGESTILKQLYDLAVNDNNLLWPSSGIKAYSIPEARLFCLWNDTPRLPWQTEAYYRQEEAALDPLEYDRVHGNKWVSGKRSFLEPGMWQACRQALPPLWAGEECVIGIDGAYKKDTFAIVVVSRRGNNVYIRETRAFVPPKGSKLNFELPKQALREIAARLNIVCFTYDPFQLHDMATTLTEEGLGWFKPFNQNNERLIADRLLYDLIAQKRIIHDLSQEEDLSKHLSNANAEIIGGEEKDGNKLRLVKKTASSKIDLAVALSMAASVALSLNIG